MPKIIQTVTVKMDNNRHEAGLAGMKRYKEFMEKSGASVSVAFALEAGPAAGHAVVATTFPSAAAWAQFVDDEGEGMVKLRSNALQATHIVSTSLMQVVDI